MSLHVDSIKQNKLEEDLSQRDSLTKHYTFKAFKCIDVYYCSYKFVTSVQ
jgi:hypothetical protein